MHSDASADGQGTQVVASKKVRVKCRSGSAPFDELMKGQAKVGIEKSAQTKGDEHAVHDYRQGR
jgi:hypothetical protein